MLDGWRSRSYVAVVVVVAVAAVIAAGHIRSVA